MPISSTKAELSLLPRLGSWGPWLATLVRLGLAVVFIWAAVPKIANPDAAVISIRAYRLLSEPAVHTVAWGLPFVELALAALLLAGVGTRPDAIAAGVLLAVYVVAIASAWARGLRIDCGCFSAGGDNPSVTGGRYAGEILCDLALLAAAGMLAWRPASRLALLLQNGQDPAQAANAALCAGDASPGGFWELHDALFAQQEPEGAGRWTAQFLVGFGHQQGIGGQSYDRCVTNGTYLGLVDQITQQAQQRGIDATPTVFINGQLQQDSRVITSPAAFEAAVARAARTSQPPAPSGARLPEPSHPRRAV